MVECDRRCLLFANGISFSLFDFIRFFFAAAVFFVPLRAADDYLDTQIFLCSPVTFQAEVLPGYQCLLCFASLRGPLFSIRMKLVTVL